MITSGERKGAIREWGGEEVQTIRYKVSYKIDNKDLCISTGELY